MLVGLHGRGAPRNRRPPVDAGGGVELYGGGSTGYPPRHIDAERVEEEEGGGDSSREGGE